MMLLDTHILYWFFFEDEKLPNSLKEQIESEKDVYISIVTFWELAIKSSLGKMKLPVSVSSLMKDCTECEFKILPITDAHLDKLSDLPWIHRDPFDRLLICQAQAEGLTLITADESIRKYELNMLWGR